MITIAQPSQSNFTTKTYSKSWETTSFSSPKLTIVPNSDNLREKPNYIQNIINQLASLDGVDKIIAFLPDPSERNCVEFHLELSSELLSLLYEESMPNSSSPEQIEQAMDQIEKIEQITQDLLIESNLELRTKTNQKWYLHSEIVESPIRLPAGAEVIASSSPKYLTRKENGSKSKFIIASYY